MISIKDICYIVAACKDNSDDIFFSPKNNDLVIAADGGYDIIKEKNIKSDILLGDFDSIKNIPAHDNIVKHPVCKDDTDTFLAYKLAFEKGYRNFVIFGGVGGRVDHTIANIHTLLHIAKNGGRGFLLGNGEIITTIYNSEIAFPQEEKGYISVFAHEKNASGVSLSGLKYCVDDITLESGLTLGTSNEFVGERAIISVSDGSLLIIWKEKSDSFLRNINSYMI